MTSPQNYIAEDTTIKGSITTASSLTVAGAIEGDINAGGDVTILPDANVRGDVSGPTVTISGKVEGRVSASGRLLITSKGHVHGDIAVRALLIEEGGTLQGQCSMGANAATLPARSSASASGNGRPATTPPSATIAPPPPRPPER
ncbi:MAG TPA: polymer-forming cytoskeletal protein [Nannocystaceae bacterium]|nr:polymer-forming cytoskeletal protein [Nannocystaceae bacterium]